MTTLTVIIATISVFSWILIQEWRNLTASNRYVVKLDRAKANERKA